MIQHIENKSIIQFPKPIKILELIKMSGGWQTLELYIFKQDDLVIIEKLSKSNKKVLPSESKPIFSYLISLCTKPNECNFIVF